MRQLHTFIIRILLDDDAETLRGQVSEPASDDGWRASFADVAELWAKLKQRLGKRSSAKNQSEGESK